MGLVVRLAGIHMRKVGSIVVNQHCHADQAKYSVTGPEGGWNPSLDKSHNQARGSPFGKESLGF